MSSIALIRKVPTKKVVTLVISEVFFSGSKMFIDYELPYHNNLLMRRSHVKANLHAYCKNTKKPPAEN